MVTANQYRAMALQHHRWAGMCRSSQSREEHFRLEKELLALADSEERMYGVRAPEQVSYPQASKHSAVKYVATEEPTVIGFCLEAGTLKSHVGSAVCIVRC